MAFLQLKQTSHINKPLLVEILVDVTGVICETNDFGDLEYKVKCKNKGSEYSASPNKDGSVYKINTGQEFDLVCSEALYKKMNTYESGANLKIEMVPNPKGGIFWNVDLSSGADFEKQKNIPKPSENTSLEIKWGMAFNNATRLVSSVPLHSDETIEDRVGLIKKLTPEMFAIACSMPEKVNEDDLPF
tara:strand:- start:7373 stop:7936 length:564 start_codon:yes stop_codon:yes gene_type:complete